MKSIDVHELKAWRDEGKAHQLIDLREDFEVETGHLGGTHIRMGDILSRAEEIRRDVPVILQCRSGGRSAAVLTALEEKFGMDNLYNLDSDYTDIKNMMEFKRDKYDVVEDDNPDVVAKDKEMEEFLREARMLNEEVRPRC